MCLHAHTHICTQAYTLAHTLLHTYTYTHANFTFTFFHRAHSDFLASFSLPSCAYQTSSHHSHCLFVHIRLPRFILTVLLYISDFLASFSLPCCTYQTSSLHSHCLAVHIRLPHFILTALLYISDFLTSFSLPCCTYQTSSLHSHCLAAHIDNVRKPQLTPCSQTSIPAECRKDQSIFSSVAQYNFVRFVS